MVCNHRDACVSVLWVNWYFCNQQDNSVVGEVTRKIEKCTSPKLLSTGTLNEMHSLVLVAKGMVVTKLRNPNILNAVICLLSAYYAYYVFNAEYPRGVTGHSKNVFFFVFGALASPWKWKEEIATNRLNTSFHLWNRTFMQNIVVSMV